MPVVVVANPKGGVGKSTLSTNVAGYYASQGHAVMCWGLPDRTTRPPAITDCHREAETAKAHRG